MELDLPGLALLTRDQTPSDACFPGSKYLPCSSTLTLLCGTLIFPTSAFFKMKVTSYFPALLDTSHEMWTVFLLLRHTKNHSNRQQNPGTYPEGTCPLGKTTNPGLALWGERLPEYFNPKDPFTHKHHPPLSDSFLSVDPPLVFFF